MVHLGGEAAALQAGSIPDSAISIFLWHINFRPHYGPWVNPASDRNEYQEYFFGGVENTDAWGWQLYRLRVSTVLKSGRFDFPESVRPLQDCIGITFSFIQSVTTEIRNRNL
jgi:hypothetical protein